MSSSFLSLSPLLGQSEHVRPYLHLSKSVQSCANDLVTSRDAQLHAQKELQAGRSKTQQHSNACSKVNISAAEAACATVLQHLIHACEPWPQHFIGVSRCKYSRFSVVCEDRCDTTTKSGVPLVAMFRCPLSAPPLSHFRCSHGGALTTAKMQCSVTNCKKTPTAARKSSATRRETQRQRAKDSDWNGIRTHARED